MTLVTTEEFFTLFYECMYFLPFYHSQYAYEPTPVTYTVPVSNKGIPCALSVWTRRPEREADLSPPTSAEIKNKYSNTSTAFIGTYYTFLTRLKVRNSEFFTNVTLYSWLFGN